MAYLVELVKVSEDDGIIRKVWEQLFSHLPPLPLLFVPGETWLSGVRGALTVVAAEERVPREDNILPIHPILLVLGVTLINQAIFNINVASPGAESLGWDCDLVCEDVVAPFGAESACKSHEGHMDRCRTGGEYFISRPASVAIEIDEDMDTIVDNLID